MFLNNKIYKKWIKQQLKCAGRDFFDGYAAKLCRLLMAIKKRP